MTVRREKRAKQAERGQREVGKARNNVAEQAEDYSMQVFSCDSHKAAQQRTNF